MAKTNKPGQGRTLWQKVCSPFSAKAREAADITRRQHSDDKLWEEFSTHKIIKLLPDRDQINLFEEIQVRAARGEENIPTDEFL